ncbi:ATP-binding protein [Trichococcus collinsii]|uniref:ATP-binding protein n=1 Tax=Trichococcus collinsii TaxID=157076 RepID=UPI003CCBFDD1
MTKWLRPEERFSLFSFTDGQKPLYCIVLNEFLQLSIAIQWGDVIQNSTVAAAILDRFIHHYSVFQIYRKLFSYERLQTGT